MDADAAAGRCRVGTISSCGTSSKRHSGSSDLTLPIQARDRGSSFVASANVAQVERALSDSAAVHGHATAALDRLVRQQSALHQAPVVCPACGHTNTPSGPTRAWCTGDFVVCQGCRHNFEPLCSPIFDADLHVLRSAVSHLQLQSERVQYLEQMVKHRSESDACSSSKGSKSQPADASGASESSFRLRQTFRGTGKSPPRLGPHERQLQKQQLQQEQQLRGRQQRFNHSQADDSLGLASWHDLNVCRTPRPAQVPASRATPSSSSSGSNSETRGLQAAVAPTSSCSGRTDADLVSFMDSVDLMTWSTHSTSTGSEAGAPCFFGRRLQQSTLDAETQAHDALRLARKGRRSEGSRNAGGSSIGCTTSSEVTSDSDGHRSVAGVNCQLRAALSGSSMAPAKPAKEARRPLWLGNEVGKLATAKSCPTLEGTWELLLRAAQQLAVIAVVVLAARSLLLHVLGLLGVARASVPALLAAVSSTSAIGLSHIARKALERVQALDSEPTGWCHTRSVHICCWAFDLTLDEAFGLAFALAAIALALFFENWGFEGPRALRWLAVIGHALLDVSLTVGAYRWLGRNLHVAERGDYVSVVWFSIVVSNVATTTWAALTWWGSAVWSVGDAQIVGTNQSAHGDRHLIVHLPEVALACVHLVNFWLARHCQQPVLLSTCVACAGVSMATCCCCVSCAPWATLPAAPMLCWTPAIYAGFCAISGLVLWQELIQTL